MWQNGLLPGPPYVFGGGRVVVYPHFSAASAEEGWDREGWMREAVKGVVVGNNKVVMYVPFESL